MGIISTYDYYGLLSISPAFIIHQHGSSQKPLGVTKPWPRLLGRLIFASTSQKFKQLRSKNGWAWILMDFYIILCGLIIFLVGFSWIVLL
jgi:hypothetical protein